MQRQRRHDEIEGAVAERQRFLVCAHAQAAARAQRRLGQFHVDDGLDTRRLLQPPPEQSVVGAEVQGHGEAPLGDGEALQEVVCHARKEELVVRQGRGRAIAPSCQKVPVEDVAFLAHPPKLVGEAGSFNA